MKFRFLSAALFLFSICPGWTGSIGVNFGSGRAGASLAPTDSAGVISQLHWNNASGATGSITNLADDSGDGSGASIVWAADEQWSVGGSPVEPNGTLLTGFISENNDGVESTINVTGIPFASYDLYVYMSHDRVSEDVDLKGPFGTFRLKEDNTNISAPVSFNEQLSSANPDVAQTGNYAVFRSLSGGSLALSLSPTSGAGGSIDRNAISGIQIVETNLVIERPVVRNLAASEIAGTSAVIGCEIVSTGGETPGLILHYGVNDAEEGVWDFQIELGPVDGEKSEKIVSLQPGQTYFFRASATNSAGTTWAESSESFTTPLVLLPSITTLPASGINGTFASLNGEVIDSGGELPDLIFYYGTIDGGTDPASWQFTLPAGRSGDSFSGFAGNLQANTTYYFRAAAENSAGKAWSLASQTFTTPESSFPPVVINEIHYDENDKTIRAEFIELHNPGDSAIDLSGYYFSKGIDFMIPPGTILGPGGYLVVAEDPATMAGHFGYGTALGPFANGTTLKNSGETLALSDPFGNVVDEVDYQLGFPWPTVGDLLGSSPASPSIELINPLLDNSLGGNWRASGFPASLGNGGGAGDPLTLIAPGEEWHYREGASYPVVDEAGKNWWDNGYDENYDGAWQSGATSIGFGDNDDATILAAMQGSYTSLFLRKEFVIPAGEIPAALSLGCYYDDGAVVYLNGVEIARFSVLAGPVPFPVPNGFALNHEAEWSNMIIPGAAAYLVEGTNVLAIHAVNQSINSSDFSIDAELMTSPGGNTDQHQPTPGSANSSFSLNSPPQVRQVTHFPVEPKSGEAVVVSAKITDPDGVSSVVLEYQVVNPGDYFCRFLKFNSNGSENLDPRYDDPLEWTSVMMTDDGLLGDALAGDSIFSVTLPPELQTHRRLIRYRILVGDTPGATMRVPFSDDPQPNFAYFVYDGTPAWTGVIRPGDSPVTYPGELMSSIATYVLLSKNEWVNDSQFGGYTGSEYLWPGTMVYDGKVYDHIQYRPRGGVHRYQYGKNFWKFDFKRGHRFQARGRDGKRYDTDWNKLNFSSIVQQVNFNHRGEQGLFEGVGFRLFDLCGVPASRTHYTQFYVVDEASEMGSNQYNGDYYGLFLAIEQLDGQYLDEHGLPDGNLYKIEGHAGTSNNQGPDAVTDRSDVTNFISGYRNQNPTAQWWRDNFNVENYLSYRTIVEGIHHYDIAGGKNYFYYHNPVTDKFQVIPWDLDLTWADNMFGNGNHDFKTKVAGNPAFNTDYQNRVREIMDLLYNSDQAHLVIDENVRDVWSPTGPSLVGADRRLWDNNPRITTKDRYYDVAPDNEFSGMIRVVKNYVTSRGNWMVSNLLTQESSIPETPVITYSGAAGYPVSDLLFTSSDYSSSTTFAAMEWRVAEIYHPGVANYVPGKSYIYEIENPTMSGPLTVFNASYQFPVGAARVGQTYRARVRHQDSAGRWSHWSEPIEFVAGVPDVSFYVENLRISEIHYDPADATPAEQANGWVTSDFEFVELFNAGSESVDLTGVRFTKGVDFDFADGTLIAPGGYLVIVNHRAAFESRYGNQRPVAGEWDSDDRLSSGENLKLSLGNGNAIIEFLYGSNDPWPTEPNGGGYSLTLDQPLLSSPDSHANPMSWRASHFPGGSPGESDQLDFDSWIVNSGFPAETSPTDDSDGDGLGLFLEYALGSDPRVFSPGAAPSVSISSSEINGAPGDSLFLTFQRRSAAGDLTYIVETSRTLEDWTAGDAIQHSSRQNGDGTSTEVWRLPAATSAERRVFMRLRVVR